MRSATAIAALLFAATPAFAQDAGSAFAGRSLAMALDDRCGLYSDSQRAALDAGWLQARGALIRSGHHLDELTTQFAEYSRRAQTMPCDSENAAAIAADVAFAFEILGRVREMDFPGTERVWRAERPYPDYPAWSLAQYPVPGDSSRVFGFFHANGTRTLSLGMPPATAFSTARITMRDVALSPELIDASLGGLLTIPGQPRWVRYAPSHRAQTSIWASRRTVRDDAVHFAFPDRLVEALFRLDPRESVRIEVLDARGAVSETLFIEIGDFAAGTAFLSAGAGAASDATGG